MTTHKQDTSRSYTIWTIAGAIALVALIVGFSQQNQVTAHEPVPTPQPIVQGQAPRLDVVFTIDATGSMGDEIDVVKKEIWGIANQLMTGKPRPDIRFGLVFYQDQGDSFLVKRTELTRDVDAVHEQLMAITAGGGGDWREHVGRGLHETMDLNWDLGQNVTRLVYLVGDAPGHDDYQDGYDIASALRKASNKGIKVNAIGCSGLDSGTQEFRAIAEQGGGVFTQLTYQAVVSDDDGVERSVIYYDGELYEAEGVMDKAEWGRGGDKLIKEGKLKPARKALKSKAAAPGAATDNNLDDLMLDSVKEEAADKGVEY